MFCKGTSHSKGTLYSSPMLENRPRAARTAFSVVFAIASAGLAGLSSTAFGQDNRIGTVIYIELENHNWTQPAGETPQQISGNPAAPYVNGLATPGNPNAAEVSYATAYHDVLSTPNGNNPSILVDGIGQP